MNFVTVNKDLTSKLSIWCIARIADASAIAPQNAKKTIGQPTKYFARISENGRIKLDLDSILSGYGFLTMLPSGVLLNFG